MPYVNTSEILSRAKEEGYTVPAFNIADFNYIMAIIEAASKKNSPVIIQVIPKVVSQVGIEVIADFVKTIAEKVEIPVSLILDHGRDFEFIKKCIKAGWNSIMFDGSLLPYAENVRLTKRVAEFAHKYDVSVEGELGQIYGVEDDISVGSDSIEFADPKKVFEFKKVTGIDSLAVGIGTKHGLYKGSYKLDYPRLKEIISLTDCPIVIHGCSDLKENDLRKLASYGISKVNISTDLKHIYIKATKEYLKNNPDEVEPSNLLAYIRGKLTDKAMEIFDIMGSSGKVVS